MMAPAREMVRRNLAADQPFWEMVQDPPPYQPLEAEEWPPSAAATLPGPDDDVPPPWWEPDEQVAIRQRLFAVREHGAAKPLDQEG